MAYEPTVWVNGETPINETNLNKMEQGIKEAHELANGGGENVLTKDDVVDNLESTATDKPLSANQGRVIKESLGTQVIMELSGTTLTITTK